jgi:hypothetical protein
MKSIPQRRSYCHPNFIEKKAEVLRSELERATQQSRIKANLKLSHATLVLLKGFLMTATFSF